MASAVVMRILTVNIDAIRMQREQLFAYAMLTGKLFRRFDVSHEHGADVVGRHLNRAHAH